MTVLIWRILSIVAIILFIGGIVLLSILKLLGNKYYSPFHEDELIKNTKSVNSDNFIYFTTGVTKNYIPKYVICKTLYDKFLICNFAQKYVKIVYYVVQYSARRKVISVLKCAEENTVDSSKIISLHRRCKYVNVVVGQINAQTINTNVIRPLSLSKIRLHSFLSSLVMFCGLFAFRQLFCEFVLGSMYLKLFLTSLPNYLMVLVSVVLCFFSYLITSGCLRRKNAKSLSGGALEYEFL